MKNFETKVEEMIQSGEKRRLAGSNYVLQRSLRERSEEEVYESIYRNLCVSVQKRGAVLA